MDERDGIPQIDPAEAEQRVTAGAFLLDVREPNEWQAGHAPGAAHVPMGQVPDSTAGLPPSEIVVVCRSGGRSQRVAAFLRSSGFQTSNLAGGMRAWSASGRPVVTDDDQQGTVI